MKSSSIDILLHDDVIKWKHFPRYWPFVRGVHRSPLNSPHKSQWRGALMLFLICAWINGWVNNREAGERRRHSAHYDFIVMCEINHAGLTRMRRYQDSGPSISFMVTGTCPNHTPHSKVHGPNMGPSGADRTQVGSMLAPWTLLSGTACRSAS